MGGVPSLLIQDTQVFSVHLGLFTAKVSSTTTLLILTALGYNSLGMLQCKHGVAFPWQLSKSSLGKEDSLSCIPLPYGIPSTCEHTWVRGT